MTAGERIEHLTETIRSAQRDLAVAYARHHELNAQQQMSFGEFYAFVAGMIIAWETVTGEEWPPPGS